MQGHEVAIKNQADWDTYVLKNDKPVIVDFYADWCPPCKKLKPILEAAAKDNGGKWVLAVVDVDIKEVAAIAGEFANQGIPSVYLFKAGAKVDHFLGFSEKSAQDMIAKASA